MIRPILASLVASSVLTAAPARADVQFFTDEAAWEAAVASLGLAVERFDTTATHLALADEVGPPPASNQNLGATLRFDAAATGLAASFELEVQQSGAGLVFQDVESGSSVFGPDTLSLGDVDNFEDDDLEVRFTDGAARAFGIFVVGNDWAADEGMSAVDQGATAHDGPFVGTVGNQTDAFLGVVSDTPLASVLLDEGSDGDDIAVRHVRLGVPGGALPVAGGFVADANGLFGRGAVYGVQLAGSLGPPIESRFDAGAEGWTVQDNGANALVYSPSGGNPGGFVSSFDAQGGVAFDFVAPAAFEGDRSNWIGGTISWDWKALGLENDIGTNGGAALFLVGGGITLSAETGQPAAAWTSESVALVRTRFSCDAGCAVARFPPTAAEFAGVMAGVTELALRGDWVDGTGTQDETAIDNVRMTPPPAGPAPWAISAQGLLRDPSAVAIEAAGTLLIADPNGAGGTGAIVRVAGASQTLVSSGDRLVTPLGVAVDGSGSIYVADANAEGSAAVIRVDPVSGAQTLVSAGDLLDTPIGIAVEPSGTLVIADRTAFGGTGGVVRVEPGSGAQSEVASGGSFAGPTGIAVAASGDLYVADPNAFDRRGGVIHVDPSTGAQSVVSRGGWFVDPVAIAVGADGAIVVADQGAASESGGSGALIGVDPASGEQTLFARGAPFRDPVGVAVRAACANALDDDGDGLSDGADPGCAHALDLAETDAARPCDNLVEDDGDGLADLADPGCRDGLWSREDPECDDGIDNDGDGGIDHDGSPPDPQCTTMPWRLKERPASCGYGIEIALVLGLAQSLRRRGRRARAAAAIGTVLAAAILAPGAARAEEFTIVAIPDTQKYVMNDVLYGTFSDQTQWVVDNKDALNIVFVTHLGDIVEDRNRISLQWERGLAALRRLDGVVPWATAPGNHDLNFNHHNLEYLYGEFFGASNYLGKPGYRGVYQNNKNSFQLFSASGLDFLILHLEYAPPENVIDWAKGVLADHPDRRAIVSTHIFLEPGSGTRPTTPYERPDGNSPEAVWQKLIRPSCNIFLVLNGHYCNGSGPNGDGEHHRTDPNACGAPVHQAVTDYQCRSNGGDGWMRYYVFAPASDQIRAYTFSPTLGAFETDADSQFVLPYDLNP